MAGRPNLGLSAANIKVRVTEEVRAYVTRAAEEEGVSISDYIRGLIDRDRVRFQKIPKK